MWGAKSGILGILAATMALQASVTQAQAQPRPRYNEDDPQGMLPPPPPPPPPQQPMDSLDERLRREGAQTGEVQVSLIWEGPSDLDLHVFCPSGEEIYYNSRRHCGGELDIDMNADRHSMTPVENVFWSHPPPGRYRIMVVLYDRQGDRSSSIPFLVRVKLGEVKHDVRGEVNNRYPKVVVVTFDK